MSAFVGVCLKSVDLRAEVDPLTGEVKTQARAAGASGADQAALELALRLGSAWSWPVVAVTAGCPRSQGVLRDALAAGAHQAVRADVAAEQPSEVIAAALASALNAPAVTAVAGGTPGVVVCGAWSLDRGSGSVPAFVASDLHAAQALGLVGLEFTAGAVGLLLAERRLDGGRRERLRLATPAVVSVEAGALRLRRASVEGLLQASTAPIHVVPTAFDTSPAHPSPHISAYRPRARVLPPPTGGKARDRVMALAGTAVDRPPARTLTLDPGEAADAILDQLRAWGYLP